MKILFVICEGPHDAQFIGRLLKESGQYHNFDENLKAYPSPLKEFISGKYTEQNVDSIRIGKPTFPLIPVCAFKGNDSDQLILSVSMGGMDKYCETIEFVKEVQNAFADDILKQSKSIIGIVSFLFVYDADSRGIAQTEQLFKERFNSELNLTGDINQSKWFQSNDFMSSLFIFTGDDGDSGTLEDNLLALFKNRNEDWVNNSDSHIRNEFEEISDNADTIAHTAKINKGILTTCGQVEKSIAGYALTVVVRDTKLLNEAFDFSDQNTQWSKLLKLINGAFV